MKRPGANAARRATTALTAVTAVVLLLALSACATLTARLEPPRVSLAGLELTELGVFEQRYRLRLRVQNPNDVALPITGMAFRLDLNEREFAHGVSDGKVTVPAFGEAELDVTVTSTLAGLVDQLQRLGRGESDRFAYRLSGLVRLARPAMNYPVDYRGEIGLAPAGQGATP